MHPLRVASSIALGAVASVLALLLPFLWLSGGPRIFNKGATTLTKTIIDALISVNITGVYGISRCLSMEYVILYVTVRKLYGMYAENASERMNLYIKALHSRNEEIAMEILSQAITISRAGSKLLHSIKLLEGSLQWEKPWLRFIIPCFTDPGNGLHDIESPMKGMEIVLTSSPCFQTTMIDEELILVSHCVLHLLCLKQEQARRLLPSNSMITPEKEVDLVEGPDPTINAVKGKKVEYNCKVAKTAEIDGHCSRGLTLAISFETGKIAIFTVAKARAQGTALGCLWKKQRHLNSQVEKLQKFIVDAKLEPGFWFTPFPVSCYKKLQRSLSNVMHLLHFMAYSIESLTQALDSCDADGKKIHEHLNQDRQILKEAISSSMKCIDKTIFIGLPRTFQDQPEDRKIDLEERKSQREYTTTSTSDKEWKALGDFLEHSKEVIDNMTSIKGKEEEIIRKVILCLCSIGFCMSCLMREVKDIEKDIKELVNWNIH
ncbi:uncharacterized protein LOC129876935 [Solanum dulcamara]|uniref:uncharacterized protein LOC129876935 n=1 Tax=Solanum dulcamara TaxID=45834 RepID=UPI0024850E1D|nr:uncharacterized protein LOC129876935 [Solanum dulcamara]